MFSKFFINRPVFAAVLSIVIVIAGAICLAISPVEEYPQLSPPQVVVSATYPGADAQTIADTVAAPLEEAVNGVDDMIYMQSSASSSGMMSLSIFFKAGTNSQDAMVNVNNRVKSAEAKLPEEVKRLGVHVSGRGSSMLEVISFFDKTNSMNIIDLNNYLKINVIDELKRIPGVGDAINMGQKDYSMRVWIKPDLLKHYNMTASEVIASIREQNNQFSAGKFGEEPKATKNPYVYSIQPEGRLKSVEEFENLVLRTLPNGSMLRLKDVANVEIGSSNYSFYGDMNGHEAAFVMIFLQNDANALEVADLVKNKLEELSKTFPENLNYLVNYDTTEFVKISIKEVIKTFIEAIILVIIVMYFFLGNIRATIIPMMAVPVSIIGTFTGLYVIGFSINLITLFALVLAIGIVVDDAIIVIENVERILHEEPELSVKEATTKAVGEIFAPVISIVLVLSAVFIPVSFMEGLVGVIQRQFALTLVMAVAISGFVALTLTPALCATILQKERSKKWYLVQKFNDFFDWSTSVFTAGVAKILKHIIPSLIVVVILVSWMAGMFKLIPGGLVPEEDKGVLLVITDLPPAASLDRTIKYGDTLSKTLKSDPNAVNVASLNGYDVVAGALRENSAVSFIKVKGWDERKDANSSTFAMADRFNKMLYMNREAQSYVLNPPPINGLSLTGGFELFAESRTGKSYKEIEADIQKVLMAANQRPELTFVRTTLNTTFPQYNLKVDKEKAKILGVSLYDIFSTINATIGDYYVNDFNMIGKTFKVYLRADSEFRSSPSDLKKIFVRSSKGEMISLDTLVTLTKTLGADNVDRFNGLPAAKVMGEPKPGFTSAQAIQAIKEVFQETLGDEYNLGWTGSAYQELESTGKGQMAFIFGMIFVYLILAAQYERWIMPIAILTAVPFSVLGAVLSIWARGLNNDIYFQIGLILLIGLAAKNAILIVEFAMNERDRGKGIFDSAINAAKLRFRPIVMTSLAFTFGVLPMVLSTGAGSASRHALGTGVIGGMIFASTIAIFFIPMFFYLLEKFNSWLNEKKRKKFEIKEIK